MADTNTIKTRFKMRVRTAAEWAANDEVLLEKEVGYVSDHGYTYKVGDGVSKFSELAYAVSNSAYKLNSPIDITIGNTTKSFDGSAPVSWSLDEIGVAVGSINQAGMSEEIDDTAVVSAVKTKLGIA